jgi:putative sterol carrier protein
VSNGERLFFVARLEDGKCTEYDEVGEAPPRKEFDFIFEFPASTFEGVAAGNVDPIGAGLKGTIKITGDMRVLIKHADLVNVLHEVYAREVQTTWPKGSPPYGS